MADVVVRNVEEGLLRKLKARAKGNGRSLQAELRLILKEAAQGVTVMDRATYRALADRLRRELGPVPHSDSADLLTEDRQR